jgi:hypothetical protein
MFPIIDYREVPVDESGGFAQKTIFTASERCRVSFLISRYRNFSGGGSVAITAEILNSFGFQNNPTSGGHSITLFSNITLANTTVPDYTSVLLNNGDQIDIVITAASDRIEGILLIETLPDSA